MNSPYVHSLGDNVLIVSYVGVIIKGTVAVRYTSDAYNHCAKPHVRYAVLVKGVIHDLSWGEIVQDEDLTKE